MLDDEKDLFLKNTLQKDKIISKQANDVFKNFYAMDKSKLRDDSQMQNNKSAKIEDINQIKSEQTQKSENHNKNTENVKTEKAYISPFSAIRKLTAVAASVVVASSIGAGAALVASGKIDFNGNNPESSQIESININGGGNAADYITTEVKNEEVEIEKEVEIAKSENKYAKATLTNKGEVAVKIKKDFADAYKLKIDTDKTYKVKEIRGNVEDVFVGSMGKGENTVVFLLMSNKTVDVIQLNYGTTEVNSSNEYELYFFDQGRIEGLRNVESFEQKQEVDALSDEPFNYVNAILSDGRVKQINDLNEIDMNELATQIIAFTSQDGDEEYKIKTNDDRYIVASGWAGASNNVYYVDDGCLYHLNRADGTITKIVTGVRSIESDDEDRIIVNLKENKKVTIHREDQYIVLNPYELTESKIIDTKEDEYIIANLKSDGSISIELKTGAKSRLGIDKNVLEHYRYNFWAEGFSDNSNDTDSDENLYAGATAIYVGKLGCKHESTLTYSNKDNQCVSIDIVKLLRECEDYTSISNEYVLTVGSYPNSIAELKEETIEITLDDGDVVPAYSIEVIYNNGMKSSIAVSAVLANEGFSNFTVNENN